MLALSSCRDANVDIDKAKEEPEYEAGTVLIGFKPEVSLRDALDFLRNKNLTFSRIYTTVYISELPADSLSVINGVLSTKSYLGYSDQLGRIGSGGAIWVSPWFLKFDAESPMIGLRHAIS